MILGALLLAGGGCASQRILSAPPSAFSTERFDVHSWPEQGGAQAVAGWAEEMLAQIESILGKLNPNLRPQLKLFSTRTQFLEHAGVDDADLHGLFIWEAGEPEILIPVADCPLLVRETLAHELAHLCLARRYPNGIRWLVEGVCEYLEARLAGEDSDEGLDHVQSRLDALQRIREERSRFTFCDDPVAAAWLVAFFLDEADGARAVPLPERVTALLSLAEKGVTEVEKSFHAALADGLWKERKPR
jgi:hypothetical protein